MRNIHVLILGLLFLSPVFSQKRERTNVNSAKSKQMNIVFFLVDDYGWRDVGYNGSTFYETPHIDSFARQAVKFNIAYAACHVCSPTRASIITGCYPARIGLTDWLPGRQDFSFQRLKNVESVQHLPYDMVSLPQVLKSNGYHTAIFGKWHLGDDSASTSRQGFEVHVPQWNKGWPNGTYFSPYNMKGLEGGPEGEYLTDRLTTEALQYIEENKDKPFFLYLSHFAVHDPIMGRPDLVKKYERKLSAMQKPEGPAYILESNPDTTYPLSNETRTQLLQEAAFKGFQSFPYRSVKIKQFQDNVQFAAMVESMDESFGRVVAKLKELGIYENTIIIFFSDNGGMSAANFFKPDRVISPANLDKAFSTSNYPLRGGKGWLYEGGIREPLLIRWPGKTLPGTNCDVPVISTDFYPTLMEMVGLPKVTKQPVDGVSLVPLLEGGNEINRKAIFWHFPHYSNHGLQSPGGAIRCGDYKLLEYFESNTVQLFNLVKDPGEQQDISLTNPEKVKSLREMLHAWRKETGAKMMQSNADHP